MMLYVLFFFQAEDGIRDKLVTGVQTCALPISSRSSAASCSPVEAPLGTAARPVAPLARVTSTSTVGLPRLSRISRAWMSMMVLMTWDSGSGRLRGAAKSRERRASRRAARRPRARHAVEPLERVGHALVHRAGERVAVVVREPGRRHGLEEVHVDGAGPHGELAARVDLDGAVYHRGHDRRLRRDREHERPL